jgi:hypothetical protein
MSTSLDWNDKPAVDAAVKDVILQESRPTRAGFIVATLETEHGKEVMAFRGVDSALQRLRKRGEIKLKTGPGGGWLIAEAC